MTLAAFPLPNFTPQLHRAEHDHEITQSALLPTEGTDCLIRDPENIYLHALAIFDEQNRHCMNEPYSSHPSIRVQSSTPSVLPPNSDGRQESAICGIPPNVDDWQMYVPDMGAPATATPNPFQRARPHQRTPSASTVASTGPSSPYTANTSYPHIANTDFAPNSPGHPAQAALADQALFSKNLASTDGSLTNTAPYIPTHIAHTPNAHLAMKGFAIDYHTSDDFPPDFYQSSRHSMSSHGNDSPATPQSGVGDNYDARVYVNQNDYRRSHPNPNVQLFPTEAQAYQDELYNPSATYVSTPSSASKRNSELLSPHRNLINERLQTANLARSASPTSAISRERSPFRDGSPLAPAIDWNPNAQNMSTAASIRKQQKELAEQAEYAQHVPQLRREPTKTISPKDAVLDYTEGEQPSLFSDNMPDGYGRHTTDNEAWQNGFVSQPGSTFGNLGVATGQGPEMTPIRASSAEGATEANFNFMQLPPHYQEHASQIQPTPYQANTYAVPKMNYSDANPEFPATLTSMESSVSEGAPPASSQDNYNPLSIPQRPADTRANTGTYTCTYHGCTQRFDSHINLQRHKRDYHRSQQREGMSASAESSTGTTTSPRSTESPAPSTAGMTSAAIQERNSQAGPHKCTRINPSTNKACNTIFSRPYDLTRHEDTIHNNRKQKVRCPMCREEKTFSRNDALTRHMRVVHPEVSETFGRRGRRSD